MRVSHLIALLLLAPVFAACGGEGDYRPLARGQEGVVTVVVEPSLWDGEVGDALRETLEREILTLPAPEAAYRVEALALDSEAAFEEVQTKKNVLVVAALDDSSTTARFMRQRLPAESVAEIEAGEGVAYAKRPDLWRRRQQVVFLAAADPAELAGAIRDRGEDLVDTYDEITRVRQTDDMFEKGRQTSIEEALMAKHGFAVNAQHDYFVAVDTTDFVWLRRVLSDTWRSLFVHYTDDARPGELDADWIYATQDSLMQQYLQGTAGCWVETDYRRPLETEQMTFLGHYGYETRGLWQMVGVREDGSARQCGMGGPFVTYTFYDQATGRTYLINGMVWAPTFDKRDFLRQMEVIAHTFRTAERG